ncbi:MAG TPA: HAD family hydrolase, partial [Candidatus Aenigmarchaeota archaeon]|nr:HAD family hydrolase [Candidatus Aenigmarchaeota archaeon]
DNEADYLYKVGYKDATWITMLENRIRLGRELLNEKGSIFVRCDYNGNHYVRFLLNQIFGEENFRNEIIVKEGVIEFLEKYKDSYTIGIFTDEFKEIVEKKLEKVFGKWKKYFKFLITPEITNEMKPSEKYYDKILEITNVKEKEVAVFGNSWEKDLRIAKDKGIFTVLISNKKKGFPDIFVKDFKELDEKKIF